MSDEKLERLKKEIKKTFGDDVEIEVQEIDLSTMQHALQRHPNPEDLLDQLMRHIVGQFQFDDMEKTEACLEVFIRSAAVAAALLNVVHLKDHPDNAKECVPAATKQQVAEFENIIHIATNIHCRSAKVASPFEQKSTNEKLREELLRTIAKEDCGQA